MLIHLLHRAGQCADSIATQALSSNNLTARQFVVLSIIAEHQGCSQTTIVAATGIDRSTIAEVVRRLMDRNLVDRERARPDRREYAVVLTEWGRDVFKSLDTAWWQAEMTLLQAIPKDDRADFLRVLNQISNQFGPVTSATANRAYTA